MPDNVKPGSGRSPDPRLAPTELVPENLPSIDTSRSSTAQESFPDARLPATASPVPETFGRYRILKTLGQGAMGSVFLAEDLQLRRQVALKIPKFVESDQTLLDRFYREARAAAALRHPNICPVHDVGEFGGMHYLTMAFIEGKSLADVLKSGKALTERQVAGVIRKVALGLKEAHAQGVVHRDLKPANIMIDRRGEPIVTDFGLARQLTQNDESRLTQTGAILGTPAYMSPEQVEAGPQGAGPASDIYSLGVILYELLAGELPFQGPVTSVLAQIISKTPPNPSELREGLDPVLEAICLKAMAKSVNERYRSMAVFATALTEYLQGKSSAQPMAIEVSSQDELPPPMLLRPKPGQQSEQPSFRMSKMGGLRSAAQWCREQFHGQQFPPEQEPSQGTRAPVRRRVSERARRRNGMPSLFWAAGAGLAAVLAIVLFVQTPTGTIKIELSEPAANVEIRLDGEVVSLTALAEPLQLKATEHELVVTGQNFETVTKSFTVRNGDNPALQVSLQKKPPVVDRAPIEVVAEEALRADAPRPPSLRDGQPPALDETGLEAARLRGAWRFVEGEWNNKKITDEKRTLLLEEGRYTLTSGSLTVRGTATIDVTKAPKTVDVTPRSGGDANALGKVHLGIYDFDGTNLRLCMATAGRPRPTEFVASAGQSIEVYVREIEPSVPATSSAGGWTDLFNGRDLTGWTPVASTGAWTVRNGVLTATPGDGWLATDGDYGDFELEVEYRLPPGGNTGVFLRAPLSGAPSGAGLLEVQAIDDTFPQFRNVSDRNHTGAIVGLFAASPRANAPPDTWNKLSIRTVGPRITVAVNGVKTTEGNLEQEPQAVLKPEMRRPSGRIGLQRRAATGVEFRNIRVITLSDASAAVTRRETKPSGNNPPDQPKVSSVANVASPFQAKSVWATDNSSLVLTVTERTRDTFRATFKSNAFERQVTGTVKDNKLSWLAKDVRAIKGRAGGDNHGTISRSKDGDRIDFVWRDADGKSGTYTLRRRERN